MEAFMKKKLIVGIAAIAMCMGMIFAQASNRPARITCPKCGQSYTRAEGHTCREQPSRNMRPETPGTPHRRTSPERPSNNRTNTRR